MTINDNQQKGNWGEQYIASQLSSQGCLIRQVTQGHDTGIDLYCEKIIDGEPLMHFWCQVKTSSKWNTEKDDYNFKPKEKHIKYWLKQPIPVYIFLVPDKRETITFPYYICRVFDWLFSKNKVIKSVYKINCIKDLKNFLNKFLVGDIYLWGLMNGSVTHLKTQQGKYKKKIPGGYSIYFEESISKSLLQALFSLAKDYFSNLKTEDTEISDPDDVPYFKMLENMVEYRYDKHYHNYELLGDKYFFQNNYKKALEMFEKSLSLLQKDTNKVWDKEIKRLEKKIDLTSKNLKEINKSQ